MINYKGFIIEKFTKPFPHITIDNFFSKEALSFINVNFTEPFALNKVKKISSEVQSLVKENIPGLDKESKHYNHNFEVEVNLYHYSNQTIELLRDSHADGPSKYFQCLVYLYPPNIEYLDEEGSGRLELMEASNKEEHLDYSTSEFKVSKVLPYTHNRAVAWQSSYYSAHRFYSCPQGRRTVTFSMIDNDNPQDFWKQRISGGI